MVEVKQGKVTVYKNNTTKVYTLKEYTDTIYYRKLYTRIYQIICLIGNETYRQDKKLGDKIQELYLYLYKTLR